MNTKAGLWVIGLLGTGLLAACASVSDDGKHWIDPGGDASADGVAATQQAITGTHRVCRVLSPSNWSDTIVVPDGWTWEKCSAFGNLFSATKFSVGCMTSSGWDMGSVQNIGVTPTDYGCW